MQILIRIKYKKKKKSTSFFFSFQFAVKRRTFFVCLFGYSSTHHVLTLLKNDIIIWAWGVARIFKKIGSESEMRWYKEDRSSKKKKNEVEVEGKKINLNKALKTDSHDMDFG